MQQATKCYRCGDENLQHGMLTSTGRVGFRPDRARFMVWHTADVDVEAAICMKCGAIALTGDVEKMRALTEKSKAATASTP